MKRCPSCNRTYADDVPPFCSEDGTRLIEEPTAPPTPEQAFAPAPPVPSPQPMPQPVAQPYPAPHQPQNSSPPPQFVPQFQQRPGKKKGLAAVAMILGSISFAIMVYLLAQEISHYGVFRSMSIGYIFMRGWGIEFVLAFFLMGLAVLIGGFALFKSIKNPTVFGGKGLAIAGPVLSVIITVLVVGVFAFHRLKGASSAYPSAYSPSYQTLTPSASPSPRATSMTEDDKYRLFYAAMKTDDKFLQSEAAKKIGIIDSAGKPTSSYQSFLGGTVSWALRDTAFSQSVSTPEKARAYVNAHMSY